MHIISEVHFYNTNVQEVFLKVQMLSRSDKCQQILVVTNLTYGETISLPNYLYLKSIPIIWLKLSLISDNFRLMFSMDWWYSI